MKATKNIYNPEKENAVFAQKLKGLFEESKIPQKKLAEFIQSETAESITRQSIGQWCLGKSCPPLRTIPIIAKFFNVSTDYLLTETLVQNPEADVISVCEYTGLSEKAVLFLNSLQSRAIGEDTSPELKTDFSTLYKAAQDELNKLLESCPKIKPVINNYIQLRRTKKYDKAHEICKKYENCQDYKEAFDKAGTLLVYENIIEEHKKASIVKSRCSLMAISELLSASERETFVIDLALLFSSFNEYIEKKELKIENVEGVFDFYERTIKLPNKIVETILLDEIQTYLKNIKTELSNQSNSRWGFYSFVEEKQDEQKGGELNGSNNPKKE